MHSSNLYSSSFIQDGDMYLVIFDERLTKYSQVIGQAKAEDYSQSAIPPPTSNSTKRHSQAKEDWIEYMSRFDNSILGIVDRAFYTTAKEKGITSPEAIQLNQMFTSLVDKNPASLTLLEKLIGSSYLSGKEKNLSVEDEGSSCVWEVMLQRQMDCGTEIRSKLLPGKEDYSIFRQCLLDDPMKIVQRVKIFYGHFQSNMRINTLESFVDNLTMMHGANKENVDNSNMSLTVSSIETGSEISTGLHHRFQSICKGWESRAESVFSSALDAWDAKRKTLLADLSAERRKLDDQMAKYNQIRMRLENQDVDVVRIKEANLVARDIEYASQFDQQRERLSIDKTTLKEKIAYISDHLVALKQEISDGVYKEISRLSMLKVKCDSNLNDKKEELRTKGRSLLSFVGLDYERAEIMRVITDLEQQRQTLLSALNKVKIRQQLIVNGGVTWKELPKFDQGESELLSEGFQICLTKEVKLNSFSDTKESMKKQVETLKRSIEELKWFADKVRTGKWRKLSSMLDTRDFTKCNTEFLVELNLDEKWEEAKRDMMLIQEEQYAVDMDISDLEEKVSALQSGKLFNEIEFDVQKQEVEYNDNQSKYNHARQRLIEATNSVEDTEKDLQSSKSDLSKLQSDLSSRIQLQEKLELFLGLESTEKQSDNFGYEMVSQSSYHDLAALVHKYGEADPFWRKVADDFLCDKNDLNLSDVVEDNPVILHTYFESAKEIQEAVSTERKLRLKEKDRQINEIKNKKHSIQDRCHKAKLQKSSLEVELCSILAKQKKVNKQLTKASKGGEENETTQNELLTKKQSLLDKQKHLRSAIGALSDEMKERKQDLTRLEQAISQLQRHYKPILNRFTKFVTKAEAYHLSVKITQKIY